MIAGTHVATESGPSHTELRKAPHFETKVKSISTRPREEETANLTCAGESTGSKVKACLSGPS